MLISDKSKKNKNRVNTQSWEKQRGLNDQYT